MCIRDRSRTVVLLRDSNEAVKVVDIFNISFIPIDQMRIDILIRIGKY